MGAFSRGYSIQNLMSLTSYDVIKLTHLHIVSSTVMEMSLICCMYATNEVGNMCHVLNLVLLHFRHQKTTRDKYCDAMALTHLNGTELVTATVYRHIIATCALVIVTSIATASVMCQVASFFI